MQELLKDFLQNHILKESLKEGRINPRQPRNNWRNPLRIFQKKKKPLDSFLVEFLRNGLENPRKNEVLPVKFFEEIQASSFCLAEAEYMPLWRSVWEVMWWRMLRSKFSNFGLISVMCDSQSTMSLANNGYYNPRTKHFSIRYFFV